MQHSTNEAFSRVLIDKALEWSGCNLLDQNQVQFELNSALQSAQAASRTRLDTLFQSMLRRAFNGEV